jgi:hypothetical protein
MGTFHPVHEFINRRAIQISRTAKLAKPILNGLRASVVFRQNLHHTAGPFNEGHLRTTFDTKPAPYLGGNFDLTSAIDPHGNTAIALLPRQSPPHRRALPVMRMADGDGERIRRIS